VDVARNAWKSAYNQLELQWDRANFETWLRPTEFLSAEADTFIIGVPNSYVCDMLQYRLYDDVKVALCEAMDTEVKIEFRVHRPKPSLEEVNAEMPLFRLMSQSQDDKDSHEAPSRSSLHEVLRPPSRPDLPESEINPRMTFDRFVINNSNHIAAEAAQSIADYPATVYNPFLVYGGVGIGKTHLLQAIGNACLQRGQRVLYVPSEAFTNDLVNAIRNRTTAMFREKYRSVDVLLVDDIQFIRGKDTTQEEFFHTFNALVNFNKQVVLASDRHPRELETLEDRLRSRFQGGLVADISPPEYETRIAIMETWACERNLDIPRDMLEMIAERVPNSVRELNGMFNQIAARIRMNGVQNLTIHRAEVTLNRYKKPREHITVQSIIEVVAETFNMDTDTLKGKKRASRINHARQIAMFLAREMTESSLPQIGDFFGRSHTTVLHGCKKIEEEIEADSVLSSRIQRLRNEISSG
jgi:chromosomal replication initiator protein